MMMWLSETSAVFDAAGRVRVAASVLNSVTMPLQHGGGGRVRLNLYVEGKR